MHPVAKVRLGEIHTLVLPDKREALFLQQSRVRMESYLKASLEPLFIKKTYFIDRGPNPSKVLKQLLVLQPEQQLNVYRTLKSHLVEKGILQPSLRG